MQKNKIKICYITTIPLTIEMFVLKFIEYWHENADVDITIICNDEGDFKEKIPSFIHFLPVKMQRGISLSGLSAIIHMIEIFKKEKFDLIQYSTPNASFYASIASRIARIPVRLYCQWGIAYVGFNGVKRRIFKIVEKMICSNSTVVEPDSFGNLEFCLKEKLYTRKKAHVVGHGSASGVDLNKFNINKKQEYRSNIREKYNIADDGIVFGFVGRLDKDKGMNELLTAFMQLESNKKKLLVIGPEDKKDSLNQDLYQESLCNKDIIYCGIQRNIEKYMAAMDIFVLPSYREGFGSVIIEASAMEVPVISSRIPGPSEAVVEAETGLLVEPKNVNDLLDKMNLLLRDSTLRIEFGKKGRLYIEKYFSQTVLFETIKKDRIELLEKTLLKS